ncbi:MAG TPA: hypothetical protein GX511_01285 [Firmicutes bacterium]|nr:hypothetical protein [Bacillota bacterium]
MRFHFRLARVLAVKKIREKQALSALAERTQQRRQEEQRLEVEGRRLSAAWQGLTLPGRRPSRELMSRAGWTRSMSRRWQEQAKRTAAARAAWEGARVEFLARRVEREALTSLEARAQDAYRAALRREEVKQLDQVAGLAHARRQREGRGWHA